MQQQMQQRFQQKQPRMRVSVKERARALALSRERQRQTARVLGGAERERKCTRKTQSVNAPARERELDKQHSNQRSDWVARTQKETGHRPLAIIDEILELPMIWHPAQLLF